MTPEIVSIDILNEPSDLYPSELDSTVENGIITSDCYSQADYDKNPDEVLRYIVEDRKRLDNFNAGYWYYTNICARAKIEYKNNQGEICTEMFVSPFAVAIESDQSVDDASEDVKLSLNELKTHCSVFNIDTTNFNKLATTAFEKFVRNW